MIITIIGIVIGIIETLITLLYRRQSNGTPLGPIEKRQLGHLLSRLGVLTTASAVLGCTAADDPDSLHEGAGQ